MSMTWEPGEPLHRVGLWIRPMFELFLDAGEVDSWADAATWPTPRSGYDLDGDWS